MERMQQIHYDFKDYKKAFETYYENLSLYPNVRIVINTDHYTSGYWIETPEWSLGSTNNYTYNTKEDVDALKERVEAEIKLSEKEGRSPLLIL